MWRLCPYHLRYIGLIRSAFVVLLCMVGLSSVAVAEPQDALGWLAAMRDARKGLDFHGTAALLRDNQIHMIVVTHRVADGLERESMHSLDDPGHEVVRQSGRSTFFPPEAQRSLAGSASPRLDDIGVLPEDLASFQRFYRFSLGAREHLIGRLAQEVLIEPLDDYRYGRRFWIDVSNKLPLKYQVLNAGNVLEQLVFSELELESPQAGAMAADGAGATLSSNPESQPLESLQWRLERVPPGYKLVSYMRHSPPGKHSVEHLLFSDGLSALSLYVEALDAKAHLKKQVQHFGAVHLYVRPIGVYQITVMGEVPAAAVVLVGDGVRRVE